MRHLAAIHHSAPPRFSHPSLDRTALFPPPRIPRLPRMPFSTERHHATARQREFRPSPPRGPRCEPSLPLTYHLTIPLHRRSARPASNLHTAVAATALLRPSPRAHERTERRDQSASSQHSALGAEGELRASDSLPCSRELRLVEAARWAPGCLDWTGQGRCEVLRRGMYVANRAKMMQRINLKLAFLNARRKIVGVQA